MNTIFIVILMTIWSNDEPEIVQFGTNFLGESFMNRKDCESRLEELTQGQNFVREKGISGIVRNNLVFRSYDKNSRVDREYSCLEVSFKSSDLGNQITKGKK